MKRFLILNLLLISLFSCKTWQKISLNEPKCKILFPGSDPVLFKAFIKVAGNEISGICAIKPGNNENRLVIFSQTGITFFDISYFNDSLKTNYIASFIDKPLIRKTFLNTFSIVFEEIYSYCYVNDNKVYKCEDTKFYFNKNKIKKIKSKRAELNAFYREGGIDSLFIKYGFPKTKVSLKKIENN